MMRGEAASLKVKWAWVGWGRRGLIVFVRSGAWGERQGRSKCIHSWHESGMMQAAARTWAATVVLA
jgi:hypothetical protein